VNNHVTPHVVIVGGGFSGLACASKLAKSDNVRVTLIDKNNYQGPDCLLSVARGARFWIEAMKGASTGVKSRKARVSAMRQP